MLKLNFIISFMILYLCDCIYSEKNETNDHCNQFDTCQCMFSSGYGINLNGLNISLDVNNDTQIIFHPCSDITVNTSKPDNECSKGTSLCLVTVKVINLGPSTNFQFETSTNSSEINLVSKYKSWTTTIKLQCSRDSNELNVTNIDYNSHIAELILKSPKSCETNVFENTKLSSWTIGFLLLGTLILIYFVGGALVSKFLYDAQGVEMIPHRTFWFGIGASIMSCLTFCTNCCGNTSGYDRI